MEVHVGADAEEDEREDVVVDHLDEAVVQGAPHVADELGGGNDHAEMLVERRLPFYEFYNNVEIPAQECLETPG